MQESLRRDLRPDSRVLVIVFLAISLPILLGAGYMTYRSLWFKYGAEPAQGRIVAVRSGVPQLKVAYRTASGEKRELISAGSDLYKNYRVGDAVTVHYDAGRPEAARLDLFVDMWMFPVVLGVFGSLFFLPVLLMGGGEIRRWLTRGNLDRDGVVVQAEYQGFELAIDADILNHDAGAVRSLSLSKRNGEYVLMHNGRKRDPLDPAVQRELSLQFIVRAHWRDPATGKDHFFESDLSEQNPEPKIRNKRVAVKVDPKNLEHYRFEPPFAPSGRKTRFVD